jgi:hypothetical protein
MILTRLAAMLALPLLFACAADAPPPGAPVSGSGTATAGVNGTALTIFTYCPEGCRITSVLLVFHGLNRNAEGYRDDAIPLARKLCAYIAAPLFDTERFPAWRYQRGGIVHNGRVLPEAIWTVSLVPALVQWARAQAGQPDLPYSMIGHSAGAQFLGRVAAYEPNAAAHLVIANPSTWVEASLTTKAPYGFGGLPGGEAALKRYLASPVVVLLGGSDTGSRDLATSDEAEEQGANRLERGNNAFEKAKAAAKQHNWPFGWRKLIVPDTGHSAAVMFGSPQALEALKSP